MRTLACLNPAASGSSSAGRLAPALVVSAAGSDSVRQENVPEIAEAFIGDSAERAT